MPSPVGHSLVGVALGVCWLVPRGASREQFADALWRGRWVLLAVVVWSNAPDLDFVPGVLSGRLNAFHRGWTHSLVGCLGIALAGWLLWWVVDRGARPGLVAAAVFGHLLLDGLSGDRSEPLGIPLGWPLSEGYVLARWTLFLPLDKSSWGDLISWGNGLAVLVECCWCLPLIWLAVRGRCVRRGEDEV